MKQTKKARPVKTFKNPYAEFYSLLRKQPGYNEAFRDEIKQGIVWKYSGQKTESLKDMYAKYPANYAYMIKALKGDVDLDYDRHRKQLLAALCSWLDLKKRTFPSVREKLSYAKRIAERASRVERFKFNDILIPQLISLYSLYCNRNKALLLARNDSDKSKN